MMRMICAIHQPQYLPWLGFFDKVDQCDVFVFLDDTQFKKNEWQNRDKIKTSHDWQWLTVPVIHDFGQLIRDVHIDTSVPWQRKHVQALITNYSKAPFFDRYFPQLEEVYKEEWELLAKLNVHLIKLLCRQLGIEKKMLLSSKLEVGGAATDKLIEICKAVGVDTYLSGAGGRSYLEEEKFERSGIQWRYQSFRHTQYPQLYGKFITHMSVIDLLFNCGEQSLDKIREYRRQ